MMASVAERRSLSETRLLTLHSYLTKRTLLNFEFQHFRNFFYRLEIFTKQPWPRPQLAVSPGSKLSGHLLSTG